MSLREAGVFLTELLLLLVKVTILNISDFYQTFIHQRHRKSVEKQIILITGGGGSLGREMANRFAELGAIVVLWDIDEIAVNKVARNIEAKGGTAHFYKCDISDDKDVALAAAKLHEDIGEVDILINNAAVFYGKPLLYLNTEQVKKTISVNLLGHYWTLRQFLPRMLKRKSGQIVAIASIAGQCGSIHMVDYCGSKFGVVGMMEALEEELNFLYQDHGITLTTLLPSAFEDGLVQETTTKFQFMSPVLKLENVATMAVDAILRNEVKTTLPRRLGIILKYFGFLSSRSAWKLAQRFCECIPHEQNSVTN